MVFLLAKTSMNIFGIESSTIRPLFLMLLNDKNTIKQGFNYLSSDPIMNFFIKNFGHEIDALDRYDDNFAIALCNLIIEQQISFKAAITIKKKFANLIKSFSNKEIIKLDSDTIKSIGLS